MSLADDWRYANIQHLRGAVFKVATYEPPSDEWDHDHCSGCWAKFASFDGPDILHSGHVIRIPHFDSPEPEFITKRKEEGMRCIPQPQVQGFHLHWVCPTCFKDFRELLGFKVEL